MNYSDWCVVCREYRRGRDARHHSSLSDNKIIHKLVLNINFTKDIYYFLLYFTSQPEEN